MKILFLSKRRPQGRDLLTRPYGRFFHLPRILSERGHDVCLLLLSHKKEARSREIQYGMTWITESVFPSGPLAYIRCAKKIVEVFKPDWVVGFSDIYYGILAGMLGERYRIGSVIDAYDNYESYIPWLKPLHHLWRKALSKATLVTAAGPHLAEFLASFRADKRATIIPMAPDPHFYPIERRTCRQELGLPQGRKIVGYCGSLYRNRGVEVMFRAFEILQSQDKDLEFVLTGRRERGLSVPGSFRHLGYLPDHLVPVFLNSLDVLVIVNRPSDFGSFSYPVKLYEGMSCRIPVVVTETGPARWILGNRKEFLARPEDPVDLARKTRALLSVGRAEYDRENTWEHSCQLFERALLSETGSPGIPMRSLDAFNGD
jgi:glycosyltransferase involved in cell wall biosynthesis